MTGTNLPDPRGIGRLFVVGIVAGVIAGAVLGDGDPAVTCYMGFMVGFLAMILTAVLVEWLK